MADNQEGNNGEVPSSGVQGVAPLTGAAYAQQHFAQNKALQEQLRKFWTDMGAEVDCVGTDPQEFKAQQLPLARIKKIMKSDEDVRMISAEAPVLFAKACEFFIQEMTLRAWNAAEEHKRRTLQRGDIATAISRTEVWDFLLDTVPLEGEAAAAVAAAAAAAAGTGSGADSGAAGTAPAAAAAPAGGAPQMPPMGMFQGQFLPPGMGQMPPGMMAGAGPGGVPLPPGAMLYPGMYMPPPGQPGAQFAGMPGGMAVAAPGGGQEGADGDGDADQ